MPTRIVIYAKDIMTITGKCERTARRMIAAIRKKHEKPRGTYVTVDEFCAFKGIEEKDVRGFLK